MVKILGLLIVIFSVFGGFVLAQGKLLALWQPYEVLIICGAALGSFIISNPFKYFIIILTILTRIVFGLQYNKKSFMEILFVMFNLGTKVRRHGLMSIEDEIEEPQQSEIFTKYPQLMRNRRLLDFITDNFRVIMTANLSSYEFETLLENEMETIEEELLSPAKALDHTSDALPGFGIVAAVMGIVITMQFLGGDPKVLGFKVAAALVGTFLGILLSYGFVGPLASAMRHYLEKETKLFCCVKIFLINFIGGTSPKMAIEFARRAIFSDVRPSFIELEEYIKENR